MWIVQIALRRPYTFVVMALAILLAGGVAIARMPADIFPDIDIPIVSVVWQFAGLTPETMANIITTRSERGMTTTVNDIEHMESQTMQGVSVIRLYFQPGAKIESAVAQIAAQTTQQVGFMPDGSRPPNVVRYNAASVPILQLGLSSDTLSEQEVYDLGNNFMRTQLATIQGAAIPPPFGGKSRQVMVDLNPDALYARGLSPADVSGALSSQNVIMPSGTAKIGTREYRVEMNNSPEVIEAFNRLPIKTVNGSTVYVRDVAQVHDGYAVQQNVVRHDGKRGALLTVLKNGNESTISIVKRVKDVLPRIQSTLPPGLRVAQLFDQSIFVRAAISGVVREAVAAALLTGMMILLFLGSWRSTLIVCVSIPLSILSSLAILYAMGETINIMTLGGMALAVGILVDDATVDHRKHPPQHRHGKAPAAGHFGRRPTDLGAGVCFHLMHLHRICAGGLPGRHREIPVHAAGAGRGAGDGRVLYPVADAGAHHDPLPAARRDGLASRPGWGGRRRGRRLDLAYPPPSSIAFSRRSRIPTATFWIPPCITAGWWSAGLCCWRAPRPRSIRASVRTFSPWWTRVKSACTCARPPAPASKRPRPGWARWNGPSARLCRPTKWPRSSTTLDSPRWGSIWPGATALPSAARMERFWCRSSPSIIPASIMSAKCGAGCRSNSSTCRSSSSRPISSARF